VVYEWDASKATQNLKKHGVSFDEAASAFGDPFTLTIPDPHHSLDELRFVTIGMTAQQRLVTIVHTDRGDAVRLISARQASRKERHDYEEAKH
jgi:uncharacterized DUF497 family protein